MKRVNAMRHLMIIAALVAFLGGQTARAGSPVAIVEDVVTLAGEVGRHTAVRAQVDGVHGQTPALPVAAAADHDGIVDESVARQALAG